MKMIRTRFFQRCPELKMYRTYSLTKKLACLSTSNSSSNSSHLKKKRHKLKPRGMSFKKSKVAPTKVLAISSYTAFFYHGPGLINFQEI